MATLKGPSVSEKTPRMAVRLSCVSAIWLILRTHLRALKGMLRWKQGHPLLPIAVEDTLDVEQGYGNTLMALCQTENPHVGKNGHQIDLCFCDLADSEDPPPGLELHVAVEARPPIVAHCW